MKHLGLIISSVFIAVLVISCQTNKQQTKQSFFKQIRTEKIQSDQSVEWMNFGPAMSGYNEGFWCHPTDTSVMIMGPDMHVSFGTWDNGKSWQTTKDCDGLGIEMKRVLDVDFSHQDADFGMALDWNGWAYQTTDRGRSWTKTKELGRNYKDFGIDPDGDNAFKDGWYYEQIGMRHSELAVDPTNDNVWFVGAGDFWNVKSNHRSAQQPYGIQFKYAEYGYILKTSDKGKTWQKISDGLTKNTDVGRIIVNPNKTDSVVMATNVGLMLSADGGLSWKNNSKGLPNDLPRDLTSYYNKETGEFVLYLLEQTVYEDKGNTVTSKGGLFKSIDGGRHWKSISGNLAFNLNKINYAADIDRYYKTIAYWFGISKNEAKAKYTKLPNSILPVYNRIVVNPLNKDEVYVSYNKKHDRSFGAGDLWKTSNGGDSWISCARHGSYWKNGSDAAYWSSRSNPTGTNVAFAHLQSYMDGKPETSGNRNLAINAVGEVFLGIDQQTLRSSDNGNTWSQVDDYETAPGSKKWIGRGASNLPGRFMLHETGIKGRRLLCSGEHGLWQTTSSEAWPNKQAVAVEQIEGQVYKDGAHSISTVAVHPNDPNTIYFLSWRQEHRGKLRRSKDAGKTWENIATIFERNSSPWTGLAQQYSLSIDPINPDNMYFCTINNMLSDIGVGAGPELSKGGYGFYRSNDGGYTWEMSNNGFNKDACVRRIVLHPDNPETIFAALNDDNGGLYKSTDKGSNWNKLSIPEEIKSVNNVFIDRNNKNIYICAGRRNGSYEEGGVWKSTNNGETWSQIFKAPFVWQVETSPVNSALIVISVAGQGLHTENPFMNPGIYISKDTGDSWTKINNGLGQPDKIVDVKPDPYNEDVLWCASWGCGWYVAYLNGSEEAWLKQ